MAAEADRTDPNLGSRETRIALNETRFREINDRLAQGLRRLPDTPRLLEFICECGQRECQQHVQLTVEEYEAIRCDSRRFAVVPGHVWPEIERVVASTTRYEVVEKTGEAEQIADARDQRSPGASGLRAPEDEPPPRGREDG